MARKKAKPLTRTKLAREGARARIGKVPPTQRVEDKRRQQKHKSKWSEEQGAGSGE